MAAPGGGLAQVFQQTLAPQGVRDALRAPTSYALHCFVALEHLKQPADMPTPQTRKRACRSAGDPSSGRGSAQVFVTATQLQCPRPTGRAPASARTGQTACRARTGAVTRFRGSVRAGRRDAQPGRCCQTGRRGQLQEPYQVQMGEWAKPAVTSSSGRAARTGQASCSICARVGHLARFLRATVARGH